MGCLSKYDFPCKVQSMTSGQWNIPGVVVGWHCFYKMATYGIQVW